MRFLRFLELGSKLMKRKRAPKPVTAAVEQPRNRSSATAVSSELTRTARRKKMSTTTRINQFHALTKRLALIEKQTPKTDEVAEKLNAEAADIRRQINDLGGLHAYQRASLKGGDERKGKGACAKWLVPLLKEKYLASLLPDSTSAGKIRLLDVGALNGETYDKFKLIEPSYIDLNPQHHTVARQDFFERSVPKGEADKFHVLCLSLVVNFVDDPERRGVMLIHARKFLFPNGLLFIVLPLPCTQNSRYMTHERLSEIARAIGFEEVEHHFTKRLSYHLWRRVQDPSGKPWRAAAIPKAMVNPGPARNNFCIVISKSQ